MQQHLAALRREPPGRNHRLAALAGADALGDPVGEQVDNVVFAQIATDELLIVRPQPFAEFADGRARKQQPAALVTEGILDVAHR